MGLDAGSLRSLAGQAGLASATQPPHGSAAPPDWQRVVHLLAAVAVDRPDGPPKNPWKVAENPTKIALHRIFLQFQP